MVQTSLETRAHASSDKKQSMSNKVREGASALFSFDGTYFKCKAKFSARDISSIFFNSFFTRGLLQPPFSQASGIVTLFDHTLILAFLIEGEKEIKVLITLSPGLKGIDITFKVDPIISYLLA